MSDSRGAHNDLHSEQGARSGEHPGRSRNPVIKVHDIAWLEFEKPDLARAERSPTRSASPRVLRHRDELQLRGTDPGARACILRTVRARGSSERRSGGTTTPTCCGLPRRRVRTVRPAARDDRRTDRRSGRPERYSRPGGRRHARTRGRCHAAAAHLQLRPRTAANQRHAASAREPARVQRLGHVVLQTTKYAEALNWYLDTLGMIVSDFLFFPGQREPRPGDELHPLRPRHDPDRSPHPGDGAGTAKPLRAFGLPGVRSRRAGRRRRIPRDRGYFRSWGIGRHIQGSQIFDYWRDPDGFMVEHFADGDMFDDTLEPGWAPFTASGLAQWGPPVTKDFLGTNPKALPHEARSLITALA